MQYDVTTVCDSGFRNSYTFGTLAEAQAFVTEAPAWIQAALICESDVAPVESYKVSKDGKLAKVEG